MTEFNVDPMYIRRLYQKLSTTKMTDDSIRFNELRKWVSSRLQTIDNERESLMSRLETLNDHVETYKVILVKIEELDADGRLA